MTLNRRQFSVATSLLPLAPVLRAQETYPTRPVTLMVPFSAGSVVDLQARVIARVLAARLGQPIVIDNKVGVSGSIGAEFVSRAAPDGYTLLLGTQGTQGTNSVLYKTIRYDPVKDFVAIHGLSGNPNVLVLNPRLGIGLAVGAGRERAGRRQRRAQLRSAHASTRPARSRDQHGVRRRPRDAGGLRRVQREQARGGGLLGMPRARPGAGRFADRRDRCLSFAAAHRHPCIAAQPAERPCRHHRARGGL